MCAYSVCAVSAVPHRRDVVCTYSPVSWIQPGLDQNVCPGVSCGFWGGFMLQVYLGYTVSSQPGSSVSRLSALWQCQMLVLSRRKSCHEPRQGCNAPYKWESRDLDPFCLCLMACLDEDKRTSVDLRHTRQRVRKAMNTKLPALGLLGTEYTLPYHQMTDFRVA